MKRSMACFLASSRCRLSPHLYMDDGAPAFPGTGFFQLSGQLSQGGLVGETPGELQADRQAVGAPGQRQGNGRQTGGVADIGKGRIGEDLPGPFLGGQPRPVLVQLAQSSTGRTSPRRTNSASPSPSKLAYSSNFITPSSFLLFHVRPGDELLPVDRWATQSQPSGPSSQLVSI
jgi:hypothetical protein